MFFGRLAVIVAPATRQALGLAALVGQQLLQRVDRDRRQAVMVVLDLERCAIFTWAASGFLSSV